jgi:hypothetical protein
MAGARRSHSRRASNRIGRITRKSKRAFTKGQWQLGCGDLVNGTNTSESVKPRGPESLAGAALGWRSGRKAGGVWFHDACR